MKYERIRTGIFIERPNRFIAIVDIDGKKEACHVKNTGRCREILVEGCEVILQRSDNRDRRTKYDVIAAYKGSRLINIDSQVPNAVVAEALLSLNIIENLHTVKREVVHNDSRFDIFAEGDKKCFIEVKGVTLENDGVVMFPDAPTERGVKHLKGLMRCIDEGYDAYIFLLIQMTDVDYFVPNYAMHEEFGTVLEEASRKGVHVVAYDCEISRDSISVGKPVEIRFR